MRGGDVRTFSYVDLEDRVRRNHPLRAIRQIVNDALALLEREFAALYSPIGRPSIAPEKLLRAMLLGAFYSIRSERLLRSGWNTTFYSASSSKLALTIQLETIRCFRRTATGC